MIFVFDLDDTISKTHEFSVEYISKFLKEHNWPYKQISYEGRFAERNFDWDMDTAKSWYKQYGDEMMAHFPCKKNAVKLLQHLHKDGHIIVIATARATDWHVHPNELTLKWLNDNKIPYDKVFIGRIDKEKICDEVDADYFIDDDLGIISRVEEYFQKKGKGKAFLATSNFNKNLETPEGVTRFADFKELASQLNVKIEINP